MHWNGDQKFINFCYYLKSIIKSDHEFSNTVQNYNSNWLFMGQSRSDIEFVKYAKFVSHP